MSLKQDLVVALQTLEKELGGKLTQAPRSYHNSQGFEYKLTLPVGEGMEIQVYLDDKAKRSNDQWGGHSGTVNYTAKGKQFTFDRTGVEASFYWGSKGEDIVATLRKQVERVKEKQASFANRKEVNLGPVTLFMTLESIQRMVDTLKSGKTHTYQPSGFGTGYFFSVKPTIRNRYDTAKASAELERLVGQRVFISQFDAD